MTTTKTDEHAYTISLNTLSETERIRINIAFHYHAEILKKAEWRSTGEDVTLDAENAVKHADALLKALGYEEENDDDNQD